MTTCVQSKKHPECSAAIERGFLLLCCFPQSARIISWQPPLNCPRAVDRARPESRPEHDDINLKIFAVESTPNLLLNGIFSCVLLMIWINLLYKLKKRYDINIISNNWIINNLKSFNWETPYIQSGGFHASLNFWNFVRTPNLRNRRTNDGIRCACPAHVILHLLRSVRFWPECLFAENNSTDVCYAHVHDVEGTHVGTHICHAHVHHVEGTMMQINQYHWCIDLPHIYIIYNPTHVCPPHLSSSALFKTRFSFVGICFKVTRTKQNRTSL